MCDRCFIVRNFKESYAKSYFHLHRHCKQDYFAGFKICTSDTIEQPIQFFWFGIGYQLISHIEL